MATPPSHSQSVLPNPQVLILDGIQLDSDGFPLMSVASVHRSAPIVESGHVRSTALIGVGCGISLGRVSRFDSEYGRGASVAGILPAHERSLSRDSRMWLTPMLVKRIV